MKFLIGLLLLIASYAQAQMAERHVQPLIYLDQIPLTSEAQMTQFLEQLDSGSSSKKIMGTLVHGKNQVLEAFSEILGNRKKLFHKGEFISFKNFKHCYGEDLDCILKELWPSSVATAILYAKIKYNLNLANISKLDEAFKFQDIQTILRAFEIIDIHHNFPQLAADSKEISNNIDPDYDCNKRGAFKLVTTAYRDMNVFPRWHCLDQKGQTSTIIHELGHVVSSYLKQGNTPNRYEFATEDLWLENARWEYVSRYNHEKLQGGCFLSPYSHSDAVEDFAETFMFYAISPRYVAERCQDKADVMKNYIFKN